ncbi:MAG TPA: aldehyde reductase, partial [Acidimicrobiia bacterium]|nr:aldehyde reductase [Acidimicrobiia bacterium]
MPITDAPILVTGATGYVAAEIVRQLLDAGYRVRGTTRNVAKAEAEGHLTGLPGAVERLELMEADLLEPGAFDEAVMGCDYVMHVASPYVIDVEDPQRDLVDPAVKGTRSVLASAAAVGTVKRVVLTSSFAAISGVPKDGVWTEEDWNETSSLGRSPYAYSKTLAERAAWEFVEATGIGLDLVVINPTGVIGPSVVPRLNQSAALLVSLTTGEMPGIIDLSFPLVDVRDVAIAHIRAMESPGASGRYLCSAESRNVRQIVELARSAGIGDKYKLPRLSLDNPAGSALVRFVANFQPKGTRAFLKRSLGATWRLDTSKIRRDLGIVFRDLDQTIVEAL